VWKEELEHSELATWWPAADRALETDSTDAIAISMYRRMLKGEIHLKPDLITSSAVAHLRIEVRSVLASYMKHKLTPAQYSVVLFPFNVSGYTSFDTEPLIIEPIQIASEYACGPRPLAYTTSLAAGPCTRSFIRSFCH
jgi:hypothetical protein